MRTLIRAACPVIRRSRLAVVLAVVIAAAGCRPDPESLEGHAPDAPVRAAHELFDAFSTGSIGAVEPLLDPAFDIEAIESDLSSFLRVFAAAEERDYRFASWSWRHQDGESFHQVAYEVRLDDVYLVSDLIFRPMDEGLLLAGMRFDAFDHSPIDRNAVALEGKGPGHGVFLALGLVTPIFVVACMISCWRRRPKRRWLWLMLMPISFPIFVLDWTTGAVQLQPLAFNFFGAAFYQYNLLEPMTFQLAPPMVALLYLIVRPEPAPPPDGASEPGPEMSQAPPAA